MQRPQPTAKEDRGAMLLQVANSPHLIRDSPRPPLHFLPCYPTSAIQPCHSWNNLCVYAKNLAYLRGNQMEIRIQLQDEAIQLIHKVGERDGLQRNVNRNYSRARRSLA